MSRSKSYAKRWLMFVVVMTISVLIGLAGTAEAHAVSFNLDLTGPSTMKVGEASTISVQYWIGNDLYGLYDTPIEVSRTDVTAESALSSSDPSVLTVNGLGQISALKAGTATISAVYRDGSLERSAQLAVAVAEKEPIVSIKGARVVDYFGETVVSKKYSCYYERGRPVCPISYLTINGKKVEKGDFLTYYFKNRKRGTATVVLRGVHSRGYKDAQIIQYKIK